MKISTFRNVLRLLSIFVLLYNFQIDTSAQNYYPAKIGNEWILESTDGKQRQTYTLETPEDDADKELILLKIVTKDIDTNIVSDTDKYFVTDEPEGIKLHKTVLQQQVGLAKGIATSIFPTPKLFFPNGFTIGEKWEIEADATLNVSGVNIELNSITEFEMVGFENIVTSVGIIQNCAKIKLSLSITDPFTVQTTSYQWLAPNLGPVKYETSDGVVFIFKNFKNTPPIQEAQFRPVWQLPSQVFQATGTQLGETLTAKILENVEDYVSEVGNLGIVSVTGDLVAPGDGTGLATNSEGKQDLWVAGIRQNASVSGSITLFAENSKGRTTVTIQVTITVN